MNRSIEKIIKENRTAFDRSIPSAGHTRRFEQRLMLQQHKKGLKRRIYLAASVAAAILVLFWVLPQKDGANQAQATEVTTITNYYQFKISEQVDSINVLLNTNLEAKQLVENAISSMKKEMDSLSEMSTTVPEDTYVQALIRCYNNQITTLKTIQSILNK